jgi:hypothetical protein
MDYRSRRLVNGVIIVCLLAMATALAIGLLARRATGVDFTILFEDAKGLPVGAPVTMRGLRVGEVTRVELGGDKIHIEVDVSVFPQYAPEIPEPPGVTARIKKGLLLPGNYSVTLIRQKGSSGRMPQGGTITGVESWADEKKFEAKGAVRRAYEAAAEKTSQRIESVKDWWAERGEKKERKKIHEQLVEWLDEVEALPSDAPPVKIEALRAKAGLMAEEWRKEGFEEEATRIEEIAESLEELEKAGGEE